MTLQEFFDVKESYRLPDKIMEMLLSPDAEKTITQIKEQISCDIRDMFQEEQGDRKSLKQDFTPDCICSIVADLMIDGTCLDMCSGTGALSKMAALKRGIEINEQEFSERTIPFAILDACMNGMQGTISKADCLRNTVQETYLLEERGGISIVSLQERQEAGCFDNVIMNPPYSMKFPEADEMRIMGHKIPKSKADYGFILRGLEHLNRGGRLIAILPHGVLFRGAGEGDIRKWLVQERLINAVIGLPDKLFLNTSIPVFVLILQYDSPDILFIDASKDFIKKSAQNDMTEQQTGKVVDTFLNRQEVERYSHITSYSEIEKNDFNLNIPRYVSMLSLLKPSFSSSSATPSRPILSILSRMINTVSKLSSGKPLYCAIALRIFLSLIRIVKLWKSSLPSSVVVTMTSSISARYVDSPRISMSHCMN